MFLVEGELLTLGAIVMVLMVFAFVSLCGPDRPAGELVKPILLSDEQRILLQAVVNDERKRKSVLNRSKRRAARMTQARVQIPSG